MQTLMNVGAQLALFGREDHPAFDPALSRLERRDLGDGAWIDYLPGWVSSGQATLFRELEAAVPWRRETRRMYDRDVETPPLFAFDPVDGPARHPAVDGMAAALGAYYGEPLPHRSYALYRDGRDSVAFHRDRELRERPTALVAIVTLGGPRTFRLRPVPGARRGVRRSLAYRVGWGDLLVMGGACQSRWEHGVPKAALAAPRLAVMFRTGDPEATRHPPAR